MKQTNKQSPTMGGGYSPLTATAVTTKHSISQHNDKANSRKPVRQKVRTNIQTSDFACPVLVSPFLGYNNKGINNRTNSNITSSNIIKHKNMVFSPPACSSSLKCDLKFISSFVEKNMHLF